MIVRLLVVGMLLSGLAGARAELSEKIGAAENPATLSKGTVFHSSSEGDFRITFPEGCSKVITKVPVDPAPLVDGMPSATVILTYCDRYQNKGEGASVTSFFNVRGDSEDYPGSKQVVERVERMLETMSVRIAKENPISKVFPDSTVIEGLDVFGVETSGEGQVWVRGLIYQGDIYVIAAWKSAGELWNDPDYIEMFNSFQPGAE